MFAKRLYRYSFIFLLLLVASLKSLQGQEKLLLWGYVYDYLKQPIAFASIKVLDAKGKYQGMGVLTDLDGKYTLNYKAERDSMFLEISAIGYQTIKQPLEAKGASTRQYNFQLKEEDISLGEIVVTGERTKPTSVQRLKSDNLGQSPSASSSLEAVVATLGGATQRNEMSRQYTVRGGSFDENIVYLDGVELPRPLLVSNPMQEGLSMVNPDLTSSVDFYAGVFGVRYGDKISSVLDIQYIEPRDFFLKSYASLMEQRLALGLGRGAWQLLLGARRKSGSSLLKTLDTKGEYKPLYYDVQLLSRYRISKNWSWSFLGNYNAVNYQFTPEERMTTFGTMSQAKSIKVYFDGMERDRFETLLLASKWSYRSSDYNFSQDILASYSELKEKVAYDISSEYLFTGGEDKQASEATYDLFRGDERELGVNHSHAHARDESYTRLLSLSYDGRVVLAERRYRLAFGLRYRLEDVSDQSNSWQVSDSLGYMLQGQHIPTMYSRRADLRLRSQRIEAYAQDRFTLESAAQSVWQFTVGTRLAYWTVNRSLLFSPRLEVDYKPSRETPWRLYLGTGVYYQAPFYRELKDEISQHGESTLNKKIKAMGAYSTVMGWENPFRLGERRFRFTLEAYYKYLFQINPFVLDNIRIKYLAENSGTGYIYGLDLKLYGEFIEGVDSWLTIGLSKGQQYLHNQQIPNLQAPGLSASLFLRDYVPGYKPIKLSLRASYASGLPVLFPLGLLGKSSLEQAFTSPSYKRLDLGGAYDFALTAKGELRPWAKRYKIKSLELGIDALNLFDISNTGSYYWIKSQDASLFAIPNYLSRRIWNIYLSVGF